MRGFLKTIFYITLVAVVIAATGLYGGLLWPPLQAFQAEAAQEVRDKDALTPDAGFVLSNEHEKGLLAAISRRQQELDIREEELKAREARLASIKTDLDARAGELKKTHADIEASLKKLDEAGTDRAKRLVKIFESMGPEDAAPRLEKLDQDIAVMILATISEKKAAKILAFIEPVRAARLSQAIRLK